MKTYSISQLARFFGLSRSTLLYYDRIGLLCASERTAAGYRIYTQNEFKRLERICIYRNAGLSLADVQKLLAGSAAPSATILENRLQELEDQMLALKGQQQAIIAMLKNMTQDSFEPIVDKEMWVKMLKAAGMDEAAMARWHAEFEARAPKAHKEFLLSLGIAKDEVQKIQEWSRGNGD
ncbi:MAG: MerR family transcriptional regulator [Desulfuromonadaceae bacterium]